MIKLQRSMLAGLQAAAPTREAVCASLQNAVELEHATIPLYLYALYSLDAARNAAIAEILKSVVVEEMLHMVLAANVLNALGGSPVIAKPGFIPAYPGPLPGGVEGELRVHLRPFSMAQLDTFLAIEEPEDPIVIRARAAAAAAAAPDPHLTIGEFYAAISAAIGQLGDGVFVKPPRNQVGPDLMDDAVVVHDVASAQQALLTIVEQGEGTAKTPEEVVGGDFAHFYRFMQIRKGRRLVAVPGANPPWAYGGDPVPFDPLGVYAVPDDPSALGYPRGSAAAAANARFNYTYTSLLRVLHDLCNGQATGERFAAALGLMMSLKSLAKAMAAGIPDAAQHVGPSFEYQPVAV